MQFGAIIDKGIENWQIVQQQNGVGRISLFGKWYINDASYGIQVYARIVNEENNYPVIPWIPCLMENGQKWSCELNEIPAGGLYRIETCLAPIENKVMDWAIRGDMVHHVGIGDLFVIAGQSNAAGYGKDFAYDPPEQGIHVLRNNGLWDLASHPLNDSTGTIHSINSEYSNPGTSPYISFARQLKKVMGYPIGLLQSSQGGSALSQWNPEEEGSLYRNMMEIIQSQGGRIKGILWYQGCTDACEGLCSNYLERFKTMVLNIRKDIGDDLLPILTVQLNRCTRPPTEEFSDKAWGKLREAQRIAARTIKGVHIIPSADSMLSDAIHNSSPANLVIGERLARLALYEIYNKGFPYKAPDIIKADSVGNNQVQLTFSNIEGCLYTFEVGPDHLPFTIQDEAGLNVITHYEISDSYMLLLSLSRDIIGNCRVHGGHEQNPAFILPIDSDTHLPVLSFYGVEILRPVISI